MSAATDRRAAGWPARLTETRGLRVRTRRQACTGAAVLPAGTAGIIDGDRSSWDKLCFRADPCECCGVQPRWLATWRDFEVIQ